jgi:hypothetical protein
VPRDPPASESKIVCRKVGGIKEPRPCIRFQNRESLRSKATSSGNSRRAVQKLDGDMLRLAGIENKTKVFDNSTIKSSSKDYPFAPF